MFRVLALAAVPAVLCWSAAGQTKWAGAAGGAPRIGVFLEFDQDPSSSSILGMQREVGAAMAKTGAELSWLRVNLDPQSETFDDVAVLRFRGMCRMEESETPGPRRARLTLGATDVSDSVSSYSSVGCDQIKATISGLLTASCDRDRQVAFSRALGRVVAHELYHILAKTTAHTRHGVSKAVQNPFDLIKENFQFDQQALLGLRLRFSSFFVGRQSALGASFLPER
jgi:hypothetical protein